MTFHERFAATLAPPYYAVMFSSQRNDADPEAYDAASERMLELARTMPGYLGVESTRDGTGFGITISYWDSEQAIAAWKRQAEHAAVRERGRRNWYARFQVRVARVERAYGGP